MRKLREAVEALWAEKKRGVVEAQEKANEQVGPTPLDPSRNSTRMRVSEITRCARC
jgi:hypothetical protein